MRINGSSDCRWYLLVFDLLPLINISAFSRRNHLTGVKKELLLSLKLWVKFIKMQRNPKCSYINTDVNNKQCSILFPAYQPLIVITFTGQDQEHPPFTLELNPDLFISGWWADQYTRNLQTTGQIINGYKSIWNIHYRNSATLSSSDCDK